MDILLAFDVRDPVCVAQTPIARIWRVTRPDGTYAALKVYKDGNMQDEAPGFALLEAWDGNGAARLYAQHGSAVLIEWLDGESLGDIVRAGDDITATLALADVAMALHGQPTVMQTPLKSLIDEFDALMTARFQADCPARCRDTLQTAQRLAQHLLATQADIRPLHRDLHHDNIKNSPRGFLAFDAKGITGERAFELANAFRNPIGAEAIYSDPEVIKRRLGVWSQRFEVDPDRLLAWAAAHSALSLAWTHKGVFGPLIASDVKLIDTFLELRA